MGLLDFLAYKDPMERLYRAAGQNKVTSKAAETGGVTGAAFQGLFPYGLGNLLFGNDPKQMPEMGSDESVGVMADLASNMMMPGTFIGPKGMANLYGDDAARAMMSQAEQRLASGEPVQAVWQDMLMAKGPEGKWRHEIDDSGANISMKNDGYQGRLPVVLEHEGIYAAYPDSKQIVANYKNLGSNSGEYSPTSPYTGQEIISVNPFRAKKDTLLHELQHAVQGREGFAKGGTPNAMELEYNNARGRLHFLENDPDYLAARQKMDDIWDRVFNKGTLDGDAATAMEQEIARQHPAFAEAKEVMGKLRQFGHRITNSWEQQDASEIGFGAYQRLAGEAESRAVQDRMNMSIPERKASFPEYLTRDDLIVRGVGDGLMSLLGGVK